MKTNKSLSFIRYLLFTAVNGNAIAVYTRPDGSMHLKHECYNKKSDKCRDFENEDTLDEWLDRLDVNAGTTHPDRVYNRARLLACALDDLGVSGFSEG